MIAVRSPRLRHLSFALVAVGVAACSQAQPAPPAAKPADPQKIAVQALKAVPLVDGHNDWPAALTGLYGPHAARVVDFRADPTARPQPGHTSIPLLRQGHVGAQLWSAYVSMSLKPDQAIEKTGQQIDLIHALVHRHPETFALATTAADIEAAFRGGRIASLITLEGTHQIADDPDRLDDAYRRGVRSITLTHSRPNSLFDSATAPPRHGDENGGMSAEGVRMIGRMNQLGILVDLSHVSTAVMHKALDLATAPVIFSHSSARAITDHPRNVPDDVLKRLPQNGGMVMVTFVPAYIDQQRANWEVLPPEERAKTPRPISTLSMVADHIDHVAKVAGHDHVGIGSDFDGIPDLPQGLESVGTYPALFTELARRGWSQDNLEKLAGRNFLRVKRAAEAAAQVIQ